MENLKKSLEEAIKSAIAAQAGHTNQSFVMQGKAQAFQEVLTALEGMEQAQEIDTAPTTTKDSEA